MKTENQIARDKRNGVINLEHSFDKKTGMITSKGLIRKEINPEKLIKTLEPIRQQLNTQKEDIIKIELELKSAPVSCPSEVLEFLETQKKAAMWNRAESARAQLNQRKETYDTLTDDLIEQEKLLEEVVEWKKKKS